MTHNEKFAFFVLVCVVLGACWLGLAATLPSQKTVNVWYKQISWCEKERRILDKVKCWPVNENEKLQLAARMSVFDQDCSEFDVAPFQKELPAC